MRLGQLARKLSLKPGELVEYLQRNDFPVVEGGSNARLDDELVEKIVAELAPHLAGAIVSMSDPTKVSESQDEPQVETATEQGESTFLEVEVVAEAPGDETEDGTEQADIVSFEPIDVIRAPKIELPGLKIVGKIDLPEPKKKVETDEFNTIDEPREEGPGTRARHQKNRHPDRKQKQPRKNPIVLQREREEREARSRKINELELEKQRRTKNYLKKVKPADTRTAGKKIKKKITEEAFEEQSGEQPRTLVGKFRKWLFRS